MAGLRPRGDDHESAKRVGGRQARRAASGRAMLDPRIPGRAEGQVCAVPALLLEHLELLEEQGSREEPAGLSVAIGFGREDGCSERWLRSAVVRKTDELQGMGGGRPAEGDALPLSGSVQASNA